MSYPQPTQRFATTIDEIHTWHMEWILNGSALADSVFVNGAVNAYQYGINRFFLDDGNDTLTINGKLYSQEGGSNQVYLGDGDNVFTSLDMFAWGDGSNNSIIGGNGVDIININGAMQSTVGWNYINAGEGNNLISITNGIYAGLGGNNQVIAGAGDDYLAAGVINSQAYNAIDLGDGNNTLLAQSMFAESHSYNEVVIGNGNDQVTFNGLVGSYEYGINNIELGNGNNEFTIKGDLGAYSGGVNYVKTGYGSDDIEIQGQMHSEGTNIVYSRGGDNSVLVSGGMHANEGGNEIITGFGSDTVTLGGEITATGTNGYNYVYTGEGDDVVQLYAKVQVGGLNIDMGYGYDELVLSADDLGAFNYCYEAWLTSALQSGTNWINGIELISVEIYNTLSDFSGLSWLSSLVNSQPYFTFLELDIDHFGTDMSLGDLFHNGTASMFSVFDMTGDVANTLSVQGNLAQNNVWNDHLFIQGDSNDIVKLDSNWATQGNTVDQHGVTYDLYHSNNGEHLLIQSEISVLFG